MCLVINTPSKFGLTTAQIYGLGYARTKHVHLFLLFLAQMLCKQTRHTVMSIILKAVETQTRAQSEFTLWKQINMFLPPALPSAWKSCSETVFLSFACWFFFLSFFPPPSFPRDFGEDMFVL